MNGGLSMWAITQEERGKHEKQFDSLVPIHGYVSGEQAKKFFLQSGLPATVLAEIWNLADLGMDGKMDRLEFSIAMKLIKLKLQGKCLPSSLPVLMIQPHVVNPLALMSSSTSSAITSSSFSSPMMDLESSSSNSSSTISLASNSPRTGCSNWAVPPASRLKYRQRFNGLDKLMSGSLSGPQVRNALTASNLTQTQLANIWTLADVDKDGALRAEEFILAMHLMDMAKTGFPLPLTLPADLVPPSLRRPSELVNGKGPHIPPGLVEGAETEPTQKTKSIVSYEDCLKDNYIQGRAELEKPNLALEEEHRKEQEIRETSTREAQHTTEREAWNRKNQRNKEESTVEKSKKQRQEIYTEMEMKKREVSKIDLERRQREDWEQGKRGELERKREAMQEEIKRLRAKKRSLEMELEAMGSKHNQISDHFRDTQSKRRIQRAELDLVNQTRDRQIAEINNLQLQFEECHKKLSQLIPEQQVMTERLRNSGLKKLPLMTLTSRTRSMEKKGLSCRRLKDQLDTLERETTNKLAQMDLYNKEIKFGDMDDCYLKGLLSLLGCLSQLFLLIKELREKQARQQAILEDLYRVKEQKLRAVEKQREEEKNVREVEEATRLEKLDQKRKEEEQMEAKKRDEEKAHQMGLQEEEENREKVLERIQSVQDQGERKEEKRKKNEEDDEEEDVRKRKEHQQKEVQHSVPMPPLSTQLTTYRALYSFTARNADELSVNANCLIEVDEKAVGEQGWLFGNYLVNCGWFPHSYAEKCPSTDTIDAHPAPVLPLLPPSFYPQPHILGVEEEDTSVGLNSSSTLCTDSEPPQYTTSIVARALSSWSATPDTHDCLTMDGVIPPLLNFSQDDIIIVNEQREDWWMGQLNGTHGWFPKSYVTLETNSCTEPIYSSVGDSDSDSGQLLEFVALYPYESPEAGDLTFAEGDVILMMDCEGEWWKGCIGDKTGVFPSNYVKPREQDKIAEPDGLTKKPEIAQAVNASLAPTAEQLNLSPGQLIVVFAKNSSGWWLGEQQVRGKKRQRGWFHSSNVKLLAPNSGKSTPNPTPVCQVIAMYDYMAENQDEMTFSKGQLINVLDTTNPDWWKGEVNGIKGLIPTNYIKTTTDSDPSQLCKSMTLTPNDHLLPLPLPSLSEPIRTHNDPYWPERCASTS